MLGLEGTDVMRVARECAVWLARSELRTHRIANGGWRPEARAGQVSVVPVMAWPLLASADPPPGTAMVVVLESGAPWPFEPVEGAVAAG